jgi:hypothetical protein
MSVLTELDALEDKVKHVQQLIYDGQNTIRQEVADGLLQTKQETDKALVGALRALEDKANNLEQRLTDALARSFPLKLASGREVTVSERDALQLFAALPICLRRDTAKLELASGQTEDFKLTDLEQLADAIVAANFHQPNGGPPPGAAP